MAKFIAGSRADHIFQALHDAGVLAEKPEDVRRVIIDLEAGSAAKCYVECFLDDKIIDVLQDPSLKLAA